mgnify:FL=1
MKNKRYFFLIISIVIVLFLVLLSSLNKNNNYSTENIKNSDISDFSSSELFTNKKIVFSSILNKKEFTILNIWASWCAPCRSEHYILLDLSNNGNTNLIGLNYKDKENNAKSFISELGNPYDIILTDPSGLISIELGAYAVPETYIIKNLSKKVIKKYLGPLDNNALKEIKKIIN